MSSSGRRTIRRNIGKNGALVYQSETNNILIGLRSSSRIPAYFEKFTSEFTMGRVGRRRP